MEELDFTLKEDAEPLITDDQHYELFLGGGLNPSNFLKDQATIFVVNEAISIIENYLRAVVSDEEM